ncbi:right-handed parallel beta-helix repeat-containing protein [Tautonia sociabilis]|uniref:Right-handed parallel beta-helix repeat-containing protein n=1 Tax=Tautonia sociabilis TaxID=2080755 RepID=A0A432MK34_9BACT|nr:right-handed parallel beta-helix repeat-containing protein [Tautonia sociabilis]RUL87620.1 right-handed parallel beta-helix repeat-containing protein [Tautonia sociabilis]
MRHSLPLLLASSLLAAAWIATRPSSGVAQQGRGGLAGARPTIEAIDYASLQLAIDALPPEGGLVRLPAGTFELDEPLRITSEDVCIEGAGTATQLKNTNTDGEPTILVAPAGFDQDNRARLWRIRLANFRVTGNERSGPGIVARGVNELFVDGVTVSEHGGDGIVLDNCYEDPRICNSLITYNKGTGLNLIACHDIVVSANQFEENIDALRCTDGYNLCMTGNCVDDHLGNGVVIENTYGSVVSGNMIEECQGTAIVLDRDCYGIALSANVIAHESADGIDLRDAHGIAVTGNAFPIVRRHALVIGSASARVAVTGNSFADSTIGPQSEKRLEGDREAGGVVLDGTSDIALSGNLFSGVGPKAIEVRGNVRRVVVDGNVLTEVEEGDLGSLDNSEIGDLISPATSPSP